MRVLIFHGYLLDGTGSNVYNARLAAALVGLGHEVHLLSQDPHPDTLSFVDAVGVWDSGELRLSTLRSPVRCTVYRPDIGGLLPVYVQDRYEGMQARTFAELSDEQLASYLDANVAAVRDVLERARPDVALANHLVMGPAILARALAGSGVPYAVKIHGSALEYTVKPEPRRFLGPAREGLAGASGILVGSHHTAASLWATVEDPTVVERTRLGPPGVDVQRFAPTPAGHDPREGLRALAVRLRQGAGEHQEPPPASGAAGDDLTSAFDRDESAAAEAIERLLQAPGAGEDRLVAFVGKLIVSKGVDLLIAAWPLVLAREPRAKLVIVGFGSYRAGLERLRDALAGGDLAAAVEIARAGRSLESGPNASGSGSGSGSAGELANAGAGAGAGAGELASPSAGAGELRHLLAFLGTLRGGSRERYLNAARGLGERVVLTGRLDHEELADLLPACEALVVPSTFPEAFGMVAAEAAACGVLPVSAAHSGLAEVSERLAAAVPEQVVPWLSFPIDDRSVEALANCVGGWLAAEPQLRERARAGLVQTVRERWSWEGVGLGVIAAARGELEGLPRP